MLVATTYSGRQQGIVTDIEWDSMDYGQGFSSWKHIVIQSAVVDLYLFT
jgi:hypothetical protein